MQDRGVDILTIGGFDPSNGAGITADVKTFEALGKQALAVQTCLTVQNESDISKIYWSTEEQIREQIDILFNLHQPEYIKLSLTKDLESALSIIQYVLKQLPNARIIWDPVITSSSGFDFYDHIDKSALMEILKGIYLATPNWEEIGKWKEGDPLDTASRYSSLTYICLKGGHRPSKKGVDVLFRKGRAVHHFPPSRQSHYAKHGSGCVFASALTAFLSDGMEIKTAVRKAKDYIEAFLDSDPGLLGHHTNPAPLNGSANNRLYYLTQDMDKVSHREQAKIAINAGVRNIQIRSKEMSVDELAEEVRTIVSDAEGSASRIIINDHVELVVKTGADGVHLGSDDMSVYSARKILGTDKIIGGTANTVEDVKRLTSAGVDYIGLGPYRFTPTKKNLSPVLGLDGVKQVVSKMRSADIHMPVYVIGGVGMQDIQLILETGIHGIAISSAINLSEHPDETVRSIQQIVNAFDQDPVNELMSTL